MSHTDRTDETPKSPGALRLFIAFTLPTPVIGRIVTWQQRELAGTDVRIVSADHLHMTLVFLGHRPAGDLGIISDLLRHSASSSPQPAFTTAKYHETSRVGMIRMREVPVGADSYAGRANELVGGLMRALEERGLYKPEHRGWTPHVTVSRFRDAPHLRLTPPDLGVFSPPEIVLFKSVTRASGSVYEKLAASSMER